MKLKVRRCRVGSDLYRFRVEKLDGSIIAYSELLSSSEYTRKIAATLKDTLELNCGLKRSNIRLELQ